MEFSKQLDEIAEQIHQDFEGRSAARDAALAHSRMLTRHCANAIRAIHRDETHIAAQHLHEARQLAQALNEDLHGYREIYYAGYTQDALKEFAEASIAVAIIQNHRLPTPGELGVESATYLQGMAEVIGELRRHCMDILRNGHSEEAERLLNCMDEIFLILVTMDYPDAITGGLRRLTDIARGINERTRGDITISLRQERLEEKLKQLEKQLDRWSSP
jgi:translin